MDIGDGIIRRIDDAQIAGYLIAYVDAGNRCDRRCLLRLLLLRRRLVVASQEKNRQAKNRQPPVVSSQAFVLSYSPAKPATNRSTCSERELQAAPNADRSARGEEGGIAKRILPRLRSRRVRRERPGDKVVVIIKGRCPEQRSRVVVVIQG